jgi:hypothetical protein
MLEWFVLNWEEKNSLDQILEFFKLIWGGEIQKNEKKNTIKVTFASKSKFKNAIMPKITSNHV